MFTRGALSALSVDAIPFIGTDTVHQIISFRVIGAKHLASSCTRFFTDAFDIVCYQSISLQTEITTIGTGTLVEWQRSPRFNVFGFEFVK